MKLYLYFKNILSDHLVELSIPSLTSGKLCRLFLLNNTGTTVSDSKEKKYNQCIEEEILSFYIYIYSVQPVLTGHPICAEKVACQDWWPVIGGLGIRTFLNETLKN